VQFEGEPPPQATPDDRLAISAWNFLANGSGGIDWAGLPVVCALLGIRDLERLQVIRTHKPPE
jgi:hypothetical protein